MNSKEYNSEKLPFSVPEITDNDELAEIEKIRLSLDDGEKVHLVVKQIPDLAGSNTIFFTNKRFIMTNSFMVYGFSYDQLSDVRLTRESHSYTLAIKIHNGSYPDKTILNLKRMMEIHAQIEWKENKGFIRRIPRNKGVLLFKLVQNEIKKANSGKL